MLSSVEKEKNLFNLTLQLNTLAASIALAVYAYFGLFSRYLADDYCHSELVKNNAFFDAVQHHYITFSNRYMILAVPYLTDKFGPRGQSFLPAIMILLWVIALFWLLRELRVALKQTWNNLTLFLLASLITFFTILQAPDRYQSIYWEASSINRLVPLVLAIFLFASLLTLLRKGDAEKKTLQWSLFYFVITFLIGGFDEMNDSLIFAISFLSLVGIFLWMKKSQKRTAALWLLGSTFLASLVSMLLMVVAPHNAARITNPPTLLVFIGRILTYPKNFILDSTLTIFPLPTLLSFLVSFLIFSLLYTKTEKVTQKQQWTVFFLAPIILYALLIVNFSPSAYAQAYPANRALLGARFLMTSMFFVEGALLAILLSQIKPVFFQSTFIRFLFIAIFALFSLYPLRAAWQTLNTVDFYRQRAIAWDLRDDKIRTAKDKGEVDIHVQQFDSIHVIKELDSNPNHWVNRCAARYYGVDSISADLNYDE